LFESEERVNIVLDQSQPLPETCRRITLQSKLFLTQNEQAGCSRSPSVSCASDLQWGCGFLPSVHFRFAVLVKSVSCLWDKMKPYLQEVQPR
jgi:hypothetical protein